MGEGKGVLVDGHVHVYVPPSTISNWMMNLYKALIIHYDFISFLSVSEPVDVPASDVGEYNMIMGCIFCLFVQLSLFTCIYL